MAASSVATLVVLFMAFYGTTAAATKDDVTDCTELLLSFMVHRHGARTPVPLVLDLVKGAGAEDLQDFIEPYGYGQLNDVGKQKAYKLGQFIRRRYDELLSPQYNLSEIYIRSTDSTRAKMTVLTAMAAVYPPVEGQSWSEDINWTPVPYTTVPPRDDFNQAVVNCPVYLNAYRGRLRSKPNSLDKYADLLADVAKIINNDNITKYPALAYFLNDLYTSEISLGVDLDPKIMNLYPDIGKAADDAIDFLFGNEDYINLQAGRLLKEFFTAAFAVVAGNRTQKVRVYSAHDFNVYSLEAVTRVERQGVPDYTALYSLELRRHLETKEYVVLPVYLPTPGAKEIYLQVEGCKDLLCNLDTFHDLTSKYIIEDDAAYRDECGLTPDFIVDPSVTE